MAGVVVVADFNQTLVRERALPAWCLDRIARGRGRTRLRALGDLLLRGPLCLAIDALGGELLAARVGFGAFRGATREELVEWAGRVLTLNPAAGAALRQIDQQHGISRVVIVSRGTPAQAIAAWAAASGFGFPREILAPDLQFIAERSTGVLIGEQRRKRERGALVPEGGVYLGDARDSRWLARLERPPRFILI